MMDRRRFLGTGAIAAAAAAAGVGRILTNDDGVALPGGNLADGRPVRVEVFQPMMEAYNRMVHDLHAKQGRRFLAEELAKVRRKDPEEWGLSAMRAGLAREVVVDHFHGDKPPEYGLSDEEMMERLSAGLEPAHLHSLRVNKPVEIHYYLTDDQHYREDGITVEWGTTARAVRASLVEWRPNPTLIWK